MKVQVVMPQMGESIAEGTIIKWKKAVGDAVTKDENILEISTDKVDSEIPSPATGIFAEILVEEGQTVEVGTPIAMLETEATAETAPKATPAPAAVSAPAAPTPPAPENGSQTAAPASAPALAAAPAAATAAPARDGGDRFYSPLVRAIAKEEGVTPSELATIPGTGKGNRVSKSDILVFLKTRQVGPGAPAVSTPTLAPAAAMTSSLSDYNFGPDGTTTEPLSHMRKMIASHMVNSLQTAAHVTSVGEVDMSNIVTFREKNKKEFAQREGFNLTYTPFFAQAVVQALQEFPWVNASLDGDTIVVRNYINLGIAVALEGGKGLIVPTIKNSQDLNLTGLSRSVTELAAKARTKALSPDDVRGGTFTITNPGIFGNIMGAAIINQPQVAILGVGAIKKRAVVVNDAIAIRPICYLSLSYDHRLVDGALGGMFLQRVCQLLEEFDPTQRV